jgi:uncharacterized protein YukE
VNAVANSKQAKFIVDVSAESKHTRKSSVRFFSYDSKTAEIVIQAEKDNELIPRGTISNVEIYFESVNSSYRPTESLKWNDQMTINDDGLFLYTLTDDLLNYQGLVAFEVYINYINNDKSDSSNRIIYEQRTSAIDRVADEIEIVYIKDMETAKKEVADKAAEVKESLAGYDSGLDIYADQKKTEMDDFTRNVQETAINEIAMIQNELPKVEQVATTEKEKIRAVLSTVDQTASEVSAYADRKISEYDAKFTQSNQKMNDLQQSQTELSNQLDETKKKVDAADVYRKDEVFNKPESSANVIDQIAGVESAILKKEILVNGNEGTASRYANDLGTQNLMGILKSSRFIYDLDSNRLKAPGLIEGQTITEVTLPAGTYVVSLRLFVKSSKSTSFVCVVDGTDNSSFSFLNIQNYTINTVYTRTLELTKETQIRYKSWGNTDNEPIEFEMKIEKEKYTKFTPAPEWVIDGIVPFNEDDYNALLSTNEIVNAETYVPERGAEIVFEFPVIKALEVNRPFLFEGCTTDTEKIEKYISIMRSVLVPSASRGGGLSTATGNSSNYSRLYVKNTTNNSVRYCGTDAINSSNNLREFNTKLDTSSMKQVQKNGSYIFKITSKENENIGQSGAISDGISPAWVEVKDIRLIVEVEASANEIIKLEIAAYCRPLEQQINDLAQKVAAMENK